jgi:heme exporter protein A
MAQRLSIARAIVHNPALLLLDEPFTGLDELSAERLSEQLQTQKSSAGERSRSLVVVTHDPRRATELADRAIVLHYGRVRATPARNASSSADFEVDALRARLSELARESEADTLAAAAAAKAGAA